MKQYGDITKLTGYDLDPVDLIVGGSPCQDLSVAGKRAGLEGERSGLFMEMIRLIKEMRIKTNGIYPRFALWENVPGAFSSNKGKDFSAVLGEFARVVEPEAPDVPCPEDGWTKSGILLGSDWSMAWRTHDAQFWGVPQRRRRISLVADFRGQSAPEILFERKGLSGDTEQSGAQRKEPSGNTAESAGSTDATNVWGDTVLPTLLRRAETATGNTQDGLNVVQTISFQERSGKPGVGKGILIQYDHVGALSTMNNQMILDDKGEDTGETVDCLAGNGIDRADTAGCHGRGWTENVSYTLNTVDRPAVYPDKTGSLMASGYAKNGTQEAANGMYVVEQPQVAIMQAIGEYKMGSVSSTLKQCDYKGPRDLVCKNKESANALDTMHEQQAIMYQVASVDCRNGTENPDCNGTLQSKANGGWNANSQNIVRQTNCVRRLTPLECERLQGYPDGWTDIPGASDSKRYKALGNSIALPAWEFWAKRFVSMGGVKTIGSLFDGIGGFPLCFYRVGVKTLWTSEIEPFPIQVVHERFDEDGNLKEGWK